ncbi:DUF961 family protein [Peptoniphilaceae bacterium SGI.137]
MKLDHDLILDIEKTFGNLTFAAFRNDVFVKDLEGKDTGELERRVYTLLSSAQCNTIEVSIPANVALKEFPSGTPVVLVNPSFSAIPVPDYRDPHLNWYCIAEDLVEKKGGNGVSPQKPVGDGKEAK